MVKQETEEEHVIVNETIKKTTITRNININETNIVEDININKATDRMSLAESELFSDIP